ncbi:hypothetical protein V1517DRAFT_329644 [Lipomyces orientalis]|uniref:Uncharacterized protein n=1 Tax=Lipomyces orientalis TaxID=1233043 RepID=A0ACC3THJ1_9ASCO
MASTTPSQIGPQPKYASEDTASLMKGLNRLPLFMTELDTTDGGGGSNTALEALQALAYEGTPFEIASNFKTQGNDCFKLKQYKDAAEYYGKAIAAGSKKDTKKEDSSGNAENEKIEEIVDAKQDPGTRILVHSDNYGEETEIETENLKRLVTTCYLNRAACNLELRNYRRVINDCAEVLKLQPLNAKAYYRSARACLAIDKIKEAQECIERGLEIEPQSSYFNSLSIKVMQREDHLLKVEQQQSQREVMKKHIVRM